MPKWLLTCMITFNSQHTIRFTYKSKDCNEFEVQFLYKFQSLKRYFHNNSPNITRRRVLSLRASSTVRQ